MRRIIWHHTGGSYQPSTEDQRAYHFVITGDGEIVEGDFAPDANTGRLRPGRYAPHVASLNTGSIGIAICCMGDGRWRNPSAATLFPRPVQVEAMLRQTAILCDRYGIKPFQRSTLSHAEVEPTLGVAQSGKWDFDYDPRGVRDTRNPVAIGDELRRDLRRMVGDVAQPIHRRPTLRRGSRGDDVRELQEALGIKADGMFGPQTATAVREFQAANDLLVDGIVGPVTWGAVD